MTAQHPPTQSSDDSAKKAWHRSLRHGRWNATVIIFLILFLVVGQFQELPVLIDPSTSRWKFRTPNFPAANGSSTLQVLTSNSASRDPPSIGNLKLHPLVPNSTLADASSSLTSNFSASKGSPSTLQWKFPVANLTAANAKRAIFLLSMGQEAAESTIVERCLLSIRRRGAYLGPVVVLTDAPLQRYEALASVDPNLIVLHPRSQDWRWDLSDDMPYKRFKTYILEYLDLDDRLKPVELVYYLDVDVVVGRKLQVWFDHVESAHLSENHNHASSISFFKGNTLSWAPIQGGQFVLERNSSQGCLERWRYHIDAHPDEPKDQSALAIMWKKQKNGTPSSSICHLTRMLKKPYLQFLDEISMADLVESQNYTTMMHIRNTHHADTIPQGVQGQFFQQLLMLSPAEAQVIGKTNIHPSEAWSKRNTVTQEVKHSIQPNLV